MGITGPGTGSSNSHRHSRSIGVEQGVRVGMKEGEWGVGNGAPNQLTGVHPVEASAPRGQSLNKQTSKMRPGHLNRGKEVGGQTWRPMMPTIMIIKMHDSSHQPNELAPANDEQDSPSAAGKGVRPY